MAPIKSKLEYSDEVELKDDVETPIIEPTVVPEVKPPSIKKTRSDAQKATTARMRVKLEERRKELVIIKHEAKETALLQQMELKAHIKDKLLTKQLKTKADEKMRQMLLKAEDTDDDEDDDDVDEPEEVVVRSRKAKPVPKVVKQLPNKQPTRQSYEFPAVRFV
jgi:hypothetical protein